MLNRSKCLSLVLESVLNVSFIISKMSKSCFRNINRVLSVNVLVVALRRSNTDRDELTLRQIYGLNLSTATLSPTVSGEDGQGELSSWRDRYGPIVSVIWSLREDHHNY